MVLVDTSVWIAHFRERERMLERLLTEGLVFTHPFVRGELACGNLRKRTSVLADLAALPTVMHASEDEAMHLLESRHLWGLGLGWVDVHLLSSALISNCRFWTLDKRLRAAAAELGVA